MKIHQKLSKQALALLMVTFVASAFANDPHENHDDQDHSHPQGQLEEVPNPLPVESVVEPIIPEELPPYEALTVYLDVTWGGRTTKAATELTDSHRSYAAQGYQLQDVDIYLENGDMKGFFVTYERFNTVE